SMRADSGKQQESGSQQGSGSHQEAGSPQDAGSSQEAGSSQDAGNSQDAGSRLESGSSSQASGSQVGTSSSGEASSSSSQSSGEEPSPVTRGAWMGSNVTEYEIDWLYRSRRIPEGVTCRIPGDELIPDPEPDERVVFLAHFERGFGLPPSSFFLDLLDFYKLQPHHLPGNSVFYLSCFTTFMEAYIGIRTFFYVKNNGPIDLMLPPLIRRRRNNWSYNPKESHNETNRIIRFMKQMKDTNICSTISSAPSSRAGCFL
ncbi:hypothetical protein QYE76_071917, partial [Lolium multiflorum]